MTASAIQVRSESVRFIGVFPLQLCCVFVASGLTPLAVSSFWRGLDDRSDVDDFEAFRL
jgi:hypothetical protein